MALAALTHAGSGVLVFCVCVCCLVFAGRADHRAGWSWIADPLTKGGLARTGVGVPDLWRGAMPTRRPGMGADDLLHQPATRMQHT